MTSRPFGGREGGPLRRPLLDSEIFHPRHRPPELGGMGFGATRCAQRFAQTRRASWPGRSHFTCGHTCLYSVCASPLTPGERSQQSAPSHPAVREVLAPDAIFHSMSRRSAIHSAARGRCASPPSALAASLGHNLHRGDPRMVQQHARCFHSEGVHGGRPLPQHRHQQRSVGRCCYHTWCRCCLPKASMRI